MRLNTVKQIILDADARARSLDMNGRSELQIPVYETCLAALRIASADDDPQPAWERFMVTLCDTHYRLMLDALDPTPVEQLRRRLASIADLPELTGFGALEDIHALIAAAINVGAPRYNAGDVRGCAALYWTALHLIADAPATRGIPGYARAIAQVRPAIDLEPPAGPFTPAAVDAFAWEMRHALDAAARVTG